MRFLVIVLVALPQLVPPGACLCGMDLNARSSEPSAVQTVSVPGIAPARDCASGCCHKHRDAAEEASHEESAPLNPVERPHEPGCPAEETVSDDARVVERIDSPAETPATIRIETVPQLVVVFHQSVATGCDSHLPIPVYLAHCSLLI